MCGAEEENEEKLFIARKELEFESEKASLRLYKLKSLFLDTMAVERILLRGFKVLPLPSECPFLCFEKERNEHHKTRTHTIHIHLPRVVAKSRPSAQQSCRSLSSARSQRFTS